MAPPVRGKATRGGKVGSSSRSHAGNASLLSFRPSVPSQPPQPSRPAIGLPVTPLPSTKSIGKIIIGVDVGTTQCAVATTEILYINQEGRAAQSKPNIKLYEGWVGFYMNHIATPRTALYYELDGSPLTGNDLQPLFDDANPNTYRPDRLIRLWKLMFHHHQDEPVILNIQEQIQKQLNALGKTTDDLMRDWARLLLDHLFTDTSGISSLRQIYENFPKLDIELVVAVPPGRSTIAHEQVLQAFVQGPITSTAVSLESEPAALFRNWVHEGENDQNWIVGKRYLVADGGGGTACFVRFRLDSLSPLIFKQEFPSESVVCGAEMISDLFEKLIATKVPMDVKNRDWYIGRIRNTFDAQHKLYVGSRDRPLSFPKPSSWARSETDMITVTVDEIKDCFTACIKMLNKGIRQQLALGQNQPVDYLVLGGGLFQNLHVRNSIKESFADLTVLETSKHKGAVAKGAVLSKIYDNFISRDEITRSKATVTLLEVTSQLKKSKIYKRLHLKKGDCDGRQYFWAATYLVKQGDVSRDGQEISTETSAKDARMRYLEDDDDLKFSEKILTFNYRPGKDTWAAYTKDGAWISQQGKDMPQPEHVETITWSPSPDDTGADLNDLDTKLMEDGKQYKILKYSIQLQAKETGTKYWAKMWSSDKMKRKIGTSVWSLSKPAERKALFTAQAISQSLADSFELEDNPNKAHDTSVSTPEVASASTSAQGPRSKALVRTIESGPSQPTRSVSAHHKSPSQPKGLASTSTSTSTSIQGPSQPSASRVMPKEPQTAERPGGVGMPPSDRNARGWTPPQLPGKVDEQVAVEELGPLRDTGGCWTCLLRHKNCGKEKPQCKKCKPYGLDCNYNQPQWWGDKQVFQEQKDKYKGLVKQHSAGTKAGLSPELTRPRSMASTPSKESPHVQKTAPRSGLSGRNSPLFRVPAANVSDKSRVESHKRPRDMTEKGITPLAKRARLVGLTPVKHGNSAFSGGHEKGRKLQRPAPVAKAWDDESDEEIDHGGSFQESDIED